jgi:hypothetical protein
MLMAVLSCSQNYDDDLVNGSVGRILSFKTIREHRLLVEAGEYGEVRHSSEDTDSGSAKGKPIYTEKDEKAYPVVEFLTSSGIRVVRLVKPDGFKVDGPDGEMRMERIQVRFPGQDFVGRIEQRLTLPSSLTSQLPLIREFLAYAP